MKNNPFRIENWKAYYINLDRRPDRRAQIEAELLKQGIIAERFSALADEDYSRCPNLKLGQKTKIEKSDYLDVERICGEWGCSFSHYSILKNHLESKNDKILAVFEDDAHFCLDFKDRLRYLEDNFDLEWDIFYLSSAIKLPYNEKTSVKYVWKIEDMIYHTHSMLINPKSIAKILKLMELYAPNICAVDILYSYLIPHLKVYCFIPGMVSQGSEIPGDIGGSVLPTLEAIKMFGNHVFAEKLENYDYKNVTKFMIWFNFNLARIKYLNSPRNLGFLGKKIKTLFPSLYLMLKPYFPDKK